MAIYKRNILVITIILAGLVLRLHKIDQPILEYFPERQTQTAEITRNIYINGWPDFWIPKIRYEEDHPTPLVLELPIYNSIVAGLYVILGPYLILGRLVSISAYLVSSVFFALLILKHSNKKILLPALFIFVLSPVHVFVSRSYQPDELAFMFLIISIYCSSFSLLMISGFIKLPLYIFGLITLFKKMDIQIRSLLKYIIFFIPISIWLIRASIIMRGEGYGGNYSVFNWFNPLFFLDYHFYVSLFNILHMEVITTLGLLLLLIGILKTWNEKSMDLWKRWLFVSILYIVLFNRHVSTHEYYSLPILPPLAAYIGTGTTKIFKSIRFESKTFRKLFVFIAAILLAFALVLPAINRISNFNIKNVNPVLIERYNNLF